MHLLQTLAQLAAHYAAMSALDLELKHVAIVHRHGARTPTHSSLAGLVSPSLYQQCNLTPFLNAIQRVGDLQHQANIAKEAAARGVLADTALRMLPPALTRVAFGGPSGSAKSNSHLAASRTVEQLKSLLTKASASSCFSGQLTDAGKLMMVELGHELRELYVEKQRFLPQVLDSRTARSIYLRSTDYLRTIESLQFLVHGLYPPLKRQAPNALNLQIHVRPHSDETMYPHDDCATLAVEIKRFRDAFRANNARRLQTTLAKFPTLTRAFDGTNLSDMNKIFRIYDALQSLDGNGLPLPPGVTKEHIKELSDLVIDQWGRAFTSKDAVASLAVGRFFPELAAPLVAAARGDPKATKMSIFSGHDTTILPMLASLKAFDGEFPGYASHLRFELLQTKRPFWRRMLGIAQPRQDYVRMSYNGKARVIPACAAPGNHFPGQPELCTLEAFMAEVERIAPKNYTAACMSPIRVVPDWD